MTKFPDDVPHPANAPRGIRNHNPGNIEARDPWRGLASPDNDGRYARFTAPKWGIRAMARVLMAYERRGLVTVRQVIDTWAPPVENNTNAYIAATASRMGVDADDPVNNTAQRPALIAAIIHHENGQQPYSRELIEHGISIA